jgi:CheY-like chemotaxis protein
MKPEHEFSPEELPNIEEEHCQTQVWVIDDNTDLNVAIQRSLKGREDQGVGFVFYEEGEKALADFDRQCETKAQLPAIILVDYNLEQFGGENPKYKTGVDVIAELARICDKWQVSKPELVAYSTSGEQNELLVQAGAGSSINKSDTRQVMKYLRELRGN